MARIAKRSGPPPVPRRRLNPKFYAAVRACGRPSWLLAVDAGLTHQTVFSQLVCAEEIPDTQLNRDRLRKIADVVGFDPAELFLDGGSR